MWQLKQLERLHEIEPDVIDTVVDQILDQDVNLREKVIIGAYIDGEINLGKAAELLGMHPVRVKELFLSKGIPVKIGVATKEELLSEGHSAKIIKES